MVPSALPFHGNPVTQTPAMSWLAESGVVFDAAYTGQPAVRARPGVVHDRPAAVPHPRLRQRGGVQLGDPDVRALPAAAPATAPCCPARCTSAGPTSCTASRSGSPPTSIPPTTAGRRTGTARTSGPSWYHDMSSVIDAGPCVRSNQLDFDDEVAFAAERSLFGHIRSGDERPFCYVVSFSHPHDPFAIPRKWWDLYRDEDVPMPARRVRRGLAAPARAPAARGLRDERRRDHRGSRARGPPGVLRRDLLRRRPHRRG